MKILITLLALFFLTAANANQQSPINQKNLTVISVFPQEEIDIQILTSNNTTAGAVAFGLIGALVASAVDSNTNQLRSARADIKIESIRNILLNFDPREEMHTLVESKVKDIKGYESINFISTNIYDRETYDPLKYLKNENDELLMLKTSYSLSPDKNVLHVETKGIFYNLSIEDTADFGEEEATVYTNFFTSIYQSKMRKVEYELSSNKAANEGSGEDFGDGFDEEFDDIDTNQNGLTTLRRSIKREPWNRENLIAEINYGLNLIAELNKEAIESYLQNYENKKIKDKKEKIAYLTMTTTSKKKAKVNIFNLGNEKEPLQHYFMKSVIRGTNFIDRNVFYILPKDEILQYPAG